MPKRTFDAGITTNLKAVIGDSYKDCVRMIPIASIVPEGRNFYSMENIDLLADDIDRQGLKHNLVVRENGDDTFTVVSGHRRLAAIQLLVEDGRYKSTVVPCFVTHEEDEQESMLDLIMLNATARHMTDAERMQQYEYLRETLDTMEKNGREFTGRLREHIAKLLSVSPSQVSKIENIRNNGIAAIREAVNRGDMSISTASEIASLDKNEQTAIVAEQDASAIRHIDVVRHKREKPAQSPAPETVHLAESNDCPNVETPELETLEDFHECDGNDFYTTDDLWDGVMERIVTILKPEENAASQIDALIGKLQELKNSL